jgi:hypothetical protein
MAEARLFMGTVAPSHALLGLELDSTSNLILIRGLLRFERRFSFGVRWGFFFMISCSQGAKGAGWASAGRPRCWAVRAEYREGKKNGLGRSRWASLVEKGWPAGWADSGKVGFRPVAK